MKTRAILGLTLTLLALRAWGQSNLITSSLMVGQAIPDNNANGLVSSMDLSEISGPIVNVSVTLDITGGFNGDLYAYLVGPNGGFAVLLNRTGVNLGNGGNNSYGYGNTGFDITLNDSGANNNVHYYQNDSPAYNGSGQLTGIWASDGENVDPSSSAVGANANLGNASLSSFYMLNPNGTWVLYLADLSPGGVATLSSWTLDILTVPEPQSWLIMIGGGMAMLIMLRKQK